MAQTNADGSIILSTKIDTSGIGKGINNIKNKFAELKRQKSTLAVLTQAIKDQQYVLDKLNREYAELIANGKAESAQAQKLKERINNLSAEMRELQAAATTMGAKSTTAFAQMKSGLMALASYFIGIQTIFAAFRFSGDAAEFATQTEASVQRLVDIYGEASGAVGNFIDQNARSLGMSKAAAASFSSVYGNLFSAFADQETNAALTNEYLQMTAVVVSKTGRTAEDVQERIRSGLLGNTEAIEDLGIFVNVKTIEMTDAFQRMADGKSWEQLDAYTQQQIRSMAILEQATAKYGDEVADTSATIRNQFNAAYQDFQNSWGTIVNQVLLPVLQVLTEIFNIATAGLNALSGRSGKILEDAEVITDNSAETAENIEEQTDNQKALNKEMKKTLAGFDDIQILSAETADNTSGGGLDIGLQGIGGDFGGTFDGSDYVDEIDSTLTAIMGVVGMALAAIGCILLFTGNIAWGIGFIIAGASTFAVTMGTLKDDNIAQETQNALSNAIILAGMVAIVLGILLCMAQQWGIGIGLIVIGVSSIVTPIALNWDGIKEQLQTSFGGWLVLGGVIAIVLGILLCFTPFLPLGIGLIVLGAGAVVAPVVANWDAILNTITSTFNKIINWIETHGLAMLVLGCILCATGVALPVGLALIALGVKGMVQAKDPTTNAIVYWVKNAWNAVKNFWNANIAPIFTAAWWLAIGKNCINGLIAGFEGGINGIIMAFESMINWVVDALNKLSFDVPDWVPFIGGQNWGINIPRASFGRVSIPRLAQGAVIPPNREFIAVLGDQKRGTNIEAPLSTIQEAVAVVMDDVVQSNIAGQEAILSVLETILDAIRSIDVSDEKYANAVDSYQRKMAIVRGV